MGAAGRRRGGAITTAGRRLLGGCTTPARATPSCRTPGRTQVCDELRRLAQPHLIRQDGAADLGAVEQQQEVDAHLWRRRGGREGGWSRSHAL